MNIEAYKAIEKSDRYILPLANRRVSRLYLDFAFGLCFWDSGPKLEIRIEGKMRLSRGKETEILADPANPETLGPLLVLFGRTVNLAHAFKDGRLKVEFEENTVLQIDAGEKFEPWELVSEGGVNGLRLISMPGGSIAFWQAKP